MILLLSYTYQYFVIAAELLIMGIFACSVTFSLSFFCSFWWMDVL